MKRIAAKITVIVSATAPSRTNSIQWLISDISPNREITDITNAGPKIIQTPARINPLGRTLANPLYFGTKLSCQTSWFSRSANGT